MNILKHALQAAVSFLLSATLGIVLAVAFLTFLSYITAQILTYRE